MTFDAGTSTACSIVGTQLHVLSGAGSCSVTVTKAGDSTYAPTTSPAFAVAIGKAGQTITFAQPASPATNGTSFAVDLTSDSGLAVSRGRLGRLQRGARTVTGDRLRGHDDQRRDRLPAHGFAGR